MKIIFFYFLKFIINININVKVKKILSLGAPQNIMFSFPVLKPNKP